MTAKKKLFTDEDFDKHISVGEQLGFNKPDLSTIKVDLIWAGTDLDVCAFMLDEEGMMTVKEDLIYFKSQRRWMPEKPFNDPDFDPLKGRVSKSWKEEGFKNPIKWMEATLPLSSDNAVIGSWDDMDDGAESDECGETLHILLNEVDVSQYNTIVLAAAVAKDRIKAGESFADAHDPVVRIYDADKDELMAEYKLADNFPGKDVVCFGKMVWDPEEMMWSFEAMADAYNGGMQHLATEIFG